jgi:hypothetical protein
MAYPASPNGTRPIGKACLRTSTPSAEASSSTSQHAERFFDLQVVIIRPHLHQPGQPSPDLDEPLHVIEISNRDGAAHGGQLRSPGLSYHSEDHGRSMTRRRFSQIQPGRHLDIGLERRHGRLHADASWRTTCRPLTINGPPASTISREWPPDTRAGISSSPRKRPELVIGAQQTNLCATSCTLDFAVSDFGVRFPVRPPRASQVSHGVIAGIQS